MRRGRAGAARAPGAPARTHSRGRVPGRAGSARLQQSTPTASGRGAANALGLAAPPARPPHAPPATPKQQTATTGTNMVPGAVQYVDITVVMVSFFFVASFLCPGVVSIPPFPPRFGMEAGWSRGARPRSGCKSATHPPPLPSSTPARHAAPHCRRVCAQHAARFCAHTQRAARPGRFPATRK